MRYRWVRLYSKHCIKFGIFGSCIGFWVGGTTAYGFLSVTPVNGGTLSKPQAMNVANPANTPSSTYYYFISYPGSLAVDSNYGFKLFTPLSIVASSFPNSVSEMVTPSGSPQTDPNGFFEVEISSTARFSTTGSIVPVVYFSAETGATAGQGKPAPIATVEGRSCYDGSAAGSVCYAKNQINSTLNRYYAVRFPGTNGKIKIGFSVNDICDDAFRMSVAVSGCRAVGDSAELTKPAIRTPTTLRLMFSVGTWDTSQMTAPKPTAPQPVESLTAAASFVFQVDTPQLACPDGPTLNGSIQIGDKEIKMNTSVIGLTTPSGAASAAQFWAVGGIGAAPAPNSSFAENSFVKTVSYGSVQEIDGFENSTLTDPKKYNLAFMIQDYTGVIAIPPATGTDCRVTDVQTASIGGYLDPNVDYSTKCFVATAVFGSEESPPVVLLRQFRDQILLPSSWGQSAVKAYYHWSPPVADWLRAHPLARIPVLLVLLPITGMAWLCLNGVFFALGLLSLGMGLMWRRYRMRSSA